MRRRGISLPEILIATAVFLLISVLVVAIMSLGQRSHQRSEIHSDAYRTALIALEKIRAELAGSIVTRAAGSEIVYRYVPRQSEVTIHFTGHPEYQGPATLTLDQTVLVRRESRGPSPSDLEIVQLADLGVGGELEFEMENSRVLKVRVKAVRPDPTHPEQPKEYQQTLKVYLDNQP